MESVYILLWIDRADHLVFIDMCRQRKLDKNTIYILSAIQFTDQRKELFFCSFLRQLIRKGSDPDIFTALLFISYIHGRSRIVANLNHSQGNFRSLRFQLRRFFFQFILNGKRNCLSVDNLCHTVLLKINR